VRLRASLATHRLTQTSKRLLLTNVPVMMKLAA
jgi:hypothetical protein